MRILILLFLVSLSTEVFSCTCAKSNDRFIDGIRSKTFIFYGEVIRNDTLITRHQYNYNGKSNLDSTIHEVTVLQVKKKYHGYGALQMDTIQLLNSHGFECYKSLHNDTIGSQFILKGYFKKMQSYKYSDVGTTYENHGHFLLLSLCDQSVISIDNRLARGYITKKVAHYRRKREFRIKFYKLLDNINYKDYKWAKNYKKKKDVYGFGIQKMSFRRTENIIKNIVSEW